MPLTIKVHEKNGKQIPVITYASAWGKVYPQPLRNIDNLWDAILSIKGGPEAWGADDAEVYFNNNRSETFPIEYLQSFNSFEDFRSQDEFACDKLGIHDVYDINQVSLVGYDTDHNITYMSI